MLALFLDHKITDGGGFNASMQLANDIISFVGKNNVIMYTNIPENEKYLRDFGVRYKLISYGMYARIFDIFIKIAEKALFYPKIVSKLPMSIFERKFSNKQVTHILFLSPSRNGQFLRNIRYSISVWDMAHRDKYISPEFYEGGEWYYRQRLYSEILPKAYSIFVDSMTTKEKILLLYNILPEKIYVNKFTPSINSLTIVNQEKRPEKIIFYPAQYWAHKDHLCVIRAALILREQYNLSFKIIFCGSDKGYLDELKMQVKSLRLSKQIEFKNFVSSEYLHKLYAECDICVFASMLGPTNLPPLEALLHRKPLVLSDVHEVIENVDENYIRYFKTRSEIDLAEKINDILSLDSNMANFDFGVVMQARKQQNSLNIKDWYNTLC